MRVTHLAVPPDGRRMEWLAPWEVAWEVAWEVETLTRQGWYLRRAALASCLKTRRIGLACEFGRVLPRTTMVMVGSVAMSAGPAEDA